MTTTKLLLLLVAMAVLLAACGGDSPPGTATDERALGDTHAASSSPSTVSSSQTKEFAIACSLDDAQRQVTCSASGYADGARLSWWTNSGPENGEGGTFAFTIAQVRPDLSITLEECDGGSCQTVTTTLDTAHLMPASEQESQGKQRVVEQGISVEDQPPTLSPQLEACLREVLSPEAFSAIFEAGGRRESAEEAPLVGKCFEAEGAGGSGDQQGQGQKGQQDDPDNSAMTESIYGTDLTGCSDAVKSFDSPPVPLEQLVHIEPMGKMAGESGHITPTDHLYIKAISTGPNSVPVLAIADGYLVQIGEQSGGGDPLDLRVVIEHSCSLFSWYIHLETFSESILQQITLNQTGNWFGRVPVKSGETIGYVGYLHPYQKGFGTETDDFDWAVSDTSTLLNGFIIPDHYLAEPWKIHMVDPFDYYADPLKSDLIEKTLGAAEPAGGKIDFDIDGRLVGNWFLEGTRDYAATGLTESEKSDWPRILGMDPGECTISYWDDKLQRDIGITPCAYWLGHAVFAYDYLVPDMVLISLGLHHDGEGGLQTPWMVLGNGPHPADISVDTGPVKYELVDSGLGQGSLDRSGVPSGSDVQTVGTLLVRMLDDRSIKTELFVGVDADMVVDFTDKARIYHR